VRGLSLSSQIHRHAQGLNPHRARRTSGLTPFLVGLENLLVLAPFILLSEAALTGEVMAWGMCLGAGVVAVVRFGGLRRGIRELNFPRSLAALGLVVLAANVALLVVYRILQRTKYGVKMDFGVPYQTKLS